jgi:hypothetical protein
LENGNETVQHESETQQDETSESTTFDLGSLSHCVNDDCSLTNKTESIITNDHGKTTSVSFSSNVDIIEDSSVNVDIVEDTPYVSSINNLGTNESMLLTVNGQHL